MPKLNDISTWALHTKGGLREFITKEHHWIEQNPKKQSRWAKLARQGHAIAWEFENREGGRLYRPHPDRWRDHDCQGSASAIPCPLTPVRPRILPPLRTDISQSRHGSKRAVSVRPARERCDPEGDHEAHELAEAPRTKIKVPPTTGMPLLRKIYFISFI
jgi:hypothetical protein